MSRTNTNLIPASPKKEAELILSHQRVKRCRIYIYFLISSFYSGTDEPFYSDQTLASVVLGYKSNLKRPKRNDRLLLCRFLLTFFPI